MSLGTVAKNAILVPDMKGEAISNLYSAKRLNPLIGVGVGLAGMAYAGTKMAGASTRADGNDAAAFNQFGNLSIRNRMRSTAPLPEARGVAPSIMAGGSMPTVDDMGATGDMVFGMHNNR